MNVDETGEEAELNKKQPATEEESVEVTEGAGGEEAVESEEGAGGKEGAGGEEPEKKISKEGGDGAPIDVATDENAEDPCLSTRENLSMIYDGGRFVPYHEPYMDPLTRLFPVVEECPSHTEMPWEDILLPTNVKLRNTRKRPKEDDKGMCGTTQVIDVEINFEDNVCTVKEGGVVRSSITTGCSNSNVKQRKGSAKEYVLHIDLAKSDVNVGFQDGKGPIKPIPLGTEIQSGKETISVSANKKIGAKSSVTVSVKSSGAITTNSVKSSGAATLKHDESVESLLVHKPGQLTSTSCVPNNCPADVNRSTSVPSVPSKKTIKASVSFKRLGDDKSEPITKEGQIEPGGELKLDFPNEPISVTLKASRDFAGGAKEKSPCEKETKETCKTPPPCEKKETRESCKTPPCAKKEAEETSKTVPNIQTAPKKCSCTDLLKPDTYKQDMVMEVLQSYEAEMKPLKQALMQLQQKIRSLNLPEMKGCVCNVGPHPTSACEKPQQNNGNRSDFRSSPGPTSVPAQAPIMSCYGAPPGPSIPPNLRPADYSSLMPPVTGYAPSGSDPTSSPYSPGCTFPSQTTSPPASYLTLQAKNYGMYPDYSSRPYAQNNTYLDTFCDFRTAQTQPPQTQYPQSPAQSGRCLNEPPNVNSPSYAFSEVDEDLYQCPFLEAVKTMSKKKSEKNGRSHSDRSHSSGTKSSSKDKKKKDCPPCGDDYDDELFRSGKGIKTDPSGFKAKPTTSSKNSYHVMPKIWSKISVKHNQKNGRC